jgi:LemA protein
VEVARGASGCGYNTIHTYDEQVNAAESQIKVQLQRLADLIPNLVEAVKGYAKQEQTIFTEVAEARAKLAGAVVGFSGWARVSER